MLRVLIGSLDYFCPLFIGQNDYFGFVFYNTQMKMALLNKYFVTTCSGYLVHPTVYMFMHINYFFVSLLIISFFIQSVFAGYFAARLYKTCKGQNWKKSALLVISCAFTIIRNFLLLA